MENDRLRLGSGLGGRRLGNIRKMIDLGEGAVEELGGCVRKTIDLGWGAVWEGVG